EQVFETHHGNCHCGAFKFSVRLPELKQVFACNCSICSKKGYFWAFPSSDDLFVVEKGHDRLKDYQFGKKTMSHKVRLTHPPSSCAWPLPIQNETCQVRTFIDFDEEKLEIKGYNGADLEPHYRPPNGPAASDLNNSTKCYRGSCHCDNVSYDHLQSKALEDVEIRFCNCSICSGYASILNHRSGNHLTVYRFERKAARHAFCSIVPMVNKFEAPEVNVHVNDFMTGILPINVRTINGIGLKALKVSKIDG
ncbi:hypothetical protein BDR22DRAFT_796515, partial [Usnea florida]